MSDKHTAAQGKTHVLKTDPAVFDAVARGDKTHEIRINDRDFQVGDRLVLRETESTGSAMRIAPKLYPLAYTGRTAERIVSHIQAGYGLADGWCILSFRASEGQAQTSAAREGFVLAKQTVVEMPNGKKELGYTLLDGVGIFTSFDEVSKAIAELSLPIGWVAMTTNQLLPGWQIPEAPDVAQLADSTVPGAPVAKVWVQDDGKAGVNWLRGFEPKRGMSLYAAPTAQQSLTAGGAVPIKAQYRSPENAGDDGWCDIPMARYSDAQEHGYEVRYLYAAAPLPQVQSEALDSGREQALHAAVSAIYFEDSSDYLKTVWEVAKALAPDLFEELQSDAYAVYIKTMPAAQQAIKPSVDNDGGVA